MNYKPQQADQQWYAVLAHDKRRLEAIPCASYAAALALCNARNKVFAKVRVAKSKATMAAKVKPLLRPEAHRAVDAAPSLKGDRPTK